MNLIDFIIVFKILVTVRGLTNHDTFKGILLIAKNENNQEIIGTWSIKNSLVKTIACNNIDNTAITHSSAANKFEIVVLWHAPSMISNEKIIMQ